MIHRQECRPSTRESRRTSSCEFRRVSVHKRPLGTILEAKACRRKYRKPGCLLDRTRHVVHSHVLRHLPRFLHDIDTFGTETFSFFPPLPGRNMPERNHVLHCALRELRPVALSAALPNDAHHWNVASLVESRHCKLRDTGRILDVLALSRSDKNASAYELTFDTFNFRDSLGKSCSCKASCTVSEGRSSTIHASSSSPTGSSDVAVSPPEPASPEHQ